MIVYRVTDRVPVQIGEVTYWLSPLSVQQKTELLSLFRVKKGEEVVDNSAYALRAVRMCVKEVEGVTLVDGTPYKCEVVNGELTEECAQEIMSLGASSAKLAHACDLFAFASLNNGDLEGVTVDLSRARSLKKN